jgi:hypothetical protein
MQKLRVIFVFVLMMVRAAGGAELAPVRTVALPFPISKPAWNEANQEFYATDLQNGRLIKFDLTGQILGQTNLPPTGGSPLLSPDGSRVFVPLTASGTNQIAVVRVSDLGIERTFPITTSPQALAATSAGALIVNGAGPNLDRLETYDVTTGELLGGGTTEFGEHVLALHPLEKWLYVASYSTVRRFDLNTNSGAFEQTSPNAIRTGRGSPYINPSGNLLLTSDGNLARVNSNPALDGESAGTFEPILTTSRLCFDPFHGALFLTTYSSPTPLFFYNADSFAKADAYEISQFPSEIIPGKSLLFAFKVAETSSTIDCYVNPAIGAETNSPPQPAFVWSPETVTTIDRVTLNASATTDDSPGLTFRWDWESDGRFDTEYSTNPIVSRVFNVARPYEVTLEVKDRFGAVRSIRKVISAIGQTDFGFPGREHVPFNLPFVPAGLVAHPLAPMLFASDAISNRIVEVNLDSGKIVREFAVAFQPRKMAISPDGKHLYAGVLTHPHEPYDFTSRNGYISVFDLTANYKVRDFEISIEPDNMIATDNEQVLIVSGSGPGGVVRNYDASSGALLGSFSTVQLSSSIFLAPPQNRIFVTGGSYAISLNLASDGSLSQVNPGAPAYRSGLYGEVFLGEGGNNLIAGSGAVFDINSTGEIGNAPSRVIDSFSNAVLDPTNRALFTVVGTIFRYYNSANFEIVKTNLAAAPFTELCLSGGRLFGVSFGESNAVILEIPNPASGGANNQGPVPSFITVGPLTTRAAVRFDASATLDDHDPIEQLRFIWDFDGDGNFDTEYSASPLASHRYYVPGNHQPRLAVRDRFGAVSEKSLSITVVVEPDPGEPVLTNAPFVFPGTYLSRIVYDSKRSRAFATGDRVVWMMNLTNGIIERQWTFENQLGPMSMTPNGEQLYIGSFGVVAQFDLSLAAFVQQRPIGVNAYDLVATDSGLVIVSGVSGFQGNIEIYRWMDGELAARIPAYTDSSLSLSPSQEWFYTGSPHEAGAVRVGFDRITGVVTLINPPKATESYANGKLSFFGDERVIFPNGRIYDSSSIAADDLQFETQLSAQSIYDFASPPDWKWFVVFDGSGFDYFDGLTLASRLRLPLPSTDAFPGGAIGNHHFYLQRHEGVNRIVSRYFPALSLEENRKPEVRILSPRLSTYTNSAPELLVLVDATDFDGMITNVSLYLGTNVLRTFTEVPNGAFLPYLGLGRWVVTAVATDNLGVQSDPDTIEIDVFSPPAVYFIGPEIRSVPSGGSALLEVVAEDNDNKIARVDFYEGDRLLGSVTSPPWTFAVSNVTQRTLFRAVAIDETGLQNEASTALDVIGAQGDDFYAPFEPLGTNWIWHASNREATVQLDEPWSSGFSLTSRTLWWKWVAPRDGIARFSTVGSDFDTGLRIFFGRSISRLLQIADNDDVFGNPPASEIKIRVSKGTEYRIVVDARGDTSGDVALTLSYLGFFPEGPSNDNYVGRTSLTGDHVVVDASNEGASEEIFENWVFGSDRSVWWKWTASTNGVAVISTTGSGFDTNLRIYWDFPELFHPYGLIAENDDFGSGVQSLIALRVEEGMTYAIRVAGYNGSFGPIHLALDLFPDGAAPPANDNFANRIALPSGTCATEGSNIGATVEPGELALSYVPGNTVWYSWTSPFSGPVYLGLESTFFGRIAVFSGTNLNSLEQVFPSEAAGGLRLEAQSGQTYQLVVTSNLGPPGLFHLSINADITPPPPGFSAVQSYNGLYLNYRVNGSRRLVLMGSDDLKTWSPLETNTYSGNGSIFLDYGTNNARFFRWQDPQVP